MQTFNDKVAVITGGASGIGFAMAELFAGQGMKIVLADINQRNLDTATQKLTGQGYQAIGHLTDVSDAESVQSLADQTLATYGAVHLLCNNAGVFAGGHLWEAPLQDYQWQISVNQWGIIHGIRTFIPIMLKQDDDCHIVNTASMAAVTSMPYSGIYHMTKHAVLALSESLFHELAFAGASIHVSVLCPELVKTRIASNAKNQRPAANPLTESQQIALDSIKSGVAEGIEPDVIAERTLQAIKNNQFYIFSEDAWRRAANSRLEDVRTGRNPVFMLPIEA